MGKRNLQENKTMTRKPYRVQILLPPEKHKVLAEIARSEGRSISNLIREIIEKELEHRKLTANDDEARERRLAALERIRQHREEILKERGGKPLDFDVVEALNQMRDERDAQIWTAIIETSREIAEREQRKRTT
jgi:predicted DNA-binding protein